MNLHLTDTQRDQFQATGLVVVDADDVEQWSGVVTLTATCPMCEGDGIDGSHDAAAFYAYSGKLTNCDDCEGGVVTLGRFTIPALLPVLDAFDERAGGLWVRPFYALGGFVASGRSGLSSDDLSALWTLDPPPRPGQFIAHPERVE